MGRILCVDDDTNSAMLFRLLLKDEGHAVQIAHSVREAMSAAAAFPPDVLITDCVLNDDADGLMLARSLRKQWPQLGVIVVTGLPGGEFQNQIRDIAGARILQKPIDLQTLLSMIRDLIAIPITD